MNLKKATLYIMLLSIPLLIASKIVSNNQKNDTTVMFYNLENLFDTIDDKSRNDNDFLPLSKLKWNTQKYNSKIKNIAKVICDAAEKPTFFGVCEIENALVFKDLLNSPKFESKYNFLHKDSPDERGIDVGFAYDKYKCKVITYKTYEVKLSKNPKDKTRDILFVKLYLMQEKDTFNIMVCHFPSRREGKEASEINRIDAAKTLKNAIETNGIKKNWIIMGDFNDEPWDKAMSKTLGAQEEDNKNTNLINLMWAFKDTNKGSYNYKKKWELIDQIIISKTLYSNKKYNISSSSIEFIKKDWMMQNGKYKEFPKKNIAGIKWFNGYSDHLPILLKM